MMKYHERIDSLYNRVIKKYAKYAWYVFGSGLLAGAISIKFGFEYFPRYFEFLPSPYKEIVIGTAVGLISGTASCFPARVSLEMLRKK